MIDTASPLRAEMAKIMDSEDKVVSYNWTVEFKIKDTFKGVIFLSDADQALVDPRELNDGIFTPLKITNIDFRDDFEKTFMREIWVRVIIPFGMWSKCIYEAKDHMSCIIRRVPLKGANLEPDEDGEIEEFIYDAMFHVTEANSIAGVDYTSVSRTDLDNNQPPIAVDVELLERATEQVRKVTVGGNYRNVIPEDLIKSVLCKFTEDLEVDGEKAVTTISMVEANNKEKRDHIVIPHGMPLLDVPVFVQNNCGGVYNADLNCYAMGDKVYVYPIYQTDRFEDEKKTLTVIRVDPNLMPQVERTFRVDGDSTYILAMSNASMKDISRPKKLAGGNGVRYSDSRKFMNGFVTTKDNKAIASRKNVNSEFKAEDLGPEDTVYVANNRINSNPFKERSRLAQRAGGVYTFQWPNAQPELFYPGMPAKVLYEDNGEVKELRGVVLAAHTSIALIGKGLTASKHGTSCAITLFALPFEEE